MIGQDYVVYDFKKAGASDDTAFAFNSWVGKSAQVFADNWAPIANGKPILKPNEFRTQSYGSVMDVAPNTSVGCVNAIDNGKIESLWFVNQEHVKMIVAEMLGQPNDEELEERSLTEIELSLSKLFFDCLVRSISDGWLGKQSLDCSITSVNLNPKRLRMFRAKDLVSVSSLTIKFERGDVVVQWVLPKQETIDLMSSFVDQRSVSRSSNTPAEIVDQLPIEVVCLLGEASISMKKLSEVSVGDVVILNQKINRPVVVTIDGRPFYECWPGKLGDQQGLEIVKCS